MIERHRRDLVDLGQELHGNPKTERLIFDSLDGHILQLRSPG